MKCVVCLIEYKNISDSKANLDIDFVVAEKEQQQLMQVLFSVLTILWRILHCLNSLGTVWTIQHSIGVITFWLAVPSLSYGWNQIRVQINQWNECLMFKAQGLDMPIYNTIEKQLGLNIVHHSGVARGQGRHLSPGAGLGGTFWGAKNFSARQLVQEENMGHLQFWEFRCSV